MSAEHLLCTSHFKCFLSYDSYNRPLKGTQLFPLDRGRKVSSVGLSGHLRLHREAGSQDLNSLKTGSPFNSEHLCPAQHQG